ncbi:hypothetical protein PIB30_104132 [Stylosanthes scabra]|uniref:Uncharacterized protein n=1 Tax=Stylosanthes scabra TaxID=79078 RepID=A0ABU6VZF4_9FABA|nr:hypothetical protein [Stylosanthes scabra]
MESGIIFYEYEKREKFEDYDEKADEELGTIKIRRYHFHDESFVHPLHNVRFDPDRPYKIPIELVLTDHLRSSFDNGKSSTRGSHPSSRSSPIPHYSLRRSSSTRRVVSPPPDVARSSLHCKVAGKTLRLPKSWELIPPSEEKEEASGKEEEEEDPEEEEEDPEEEVPTSPLPMDVDATRTTFSTWRIFSVIPSTLPSIVVMLQQGVHPGIHRTNSPIVIALRVMIFPKFGHCRH